MNEEKNNVHEDKTIDKDLPKEEKTNVEETQADLDSKKNISKEKEEKHEEKHKDKHKKVKTNKEIESLKEENAKLNDKLLRTSAELANIIRRNNEEREKLLKYDGEAFIKSILPIVDDFDRAIEMDTTEDEKYLAGFKLIYANLIKVLEKFEVKEIECLGKEFDPYTMEAVLRESVITEEPNIVLTVLQKGYTYKGKVIRPAMVKVNE